jgi:F420H(2)-dependent biliverdin reductase
MSMEEGKMATELTQEIVAKLESEQIIWFGSVRPDGRPHLAPIWFVWHAGSIFIGTDPISVKSSNIRSNPRVVVALENGTNPVICEGSAKPVSTPWTDDLLAAFFQKYEWDLNKEDVYNDVIEIVPEKWLAW